jgi:UPF0271 protein
VTRCIDLSANVGENGADDEALLQVVTTANIAAGGHAGGGEVLRNALAQAIAHGVRIGVHPSYIDRENFGRHSHADELTHGNLVNQVLSQLRAFDAALAGRTPISHLKAHGALYNDAMVRSDIAAAVLDALDQFDPAKTIAVMGLPRSQMAAVTRKRGRAYIAEGFSDRAYNIDGTLVSRERDGAVLTDPEQIAQRALKMVVDGVVTTIDGKTLTIAIDTLCVHSDTSGAPLIAAHLRHTLVEAGIDVRA